MKNNVVVASLAMASVMLMLQPSAIAADKNKAKDKAQLKPVTAQAAKPAAAPQQDNLQTALALLDRSAAKFSTVETDFMWDQYQSVVDDHDIQAGTMYFRRNGNDVEMAASIKKPSNKQILFANGKVRVYLPSADQVTEYSAGKNKADFESFLVLGFGGSGRDLQKAFDVKYAGMEAVDGQQTYKLELTPKSDKVRNMFSLITLWIDKDKGVSVQQRFQEPKSGDYRLAKYTNIKLGAKLPDNAFKLNTTNATKVIRPNG